MTDRERLLRIASLYEKQQDCRSCKGRGAFKSGRKSITICGCQKALKDAYFAIVAAIPAIGEEDHDH